MSLLAFVLAAPLLYAQDGYASSELGFSFDSPGESWSQVGRTHVAGGGVEYEYRENGSEEHSIGLIVWQIDRVPGLADLCDSELDQMGARGDVEPVARQERRVAGERALSTRYRFESTEEDTPPLAVDATYFETDEFLGRLTVAVPEAELDRLDTLVPRAIELVRLESPWSGPFDFGQPEPDNVLTIVHGADDAELVYRVLEALPGAARANDGLPVVLAVQPSLGTAARAFLRKYRPGKIRRIGPAHAQLPQAVAASEDAKSGGTVVVSERNLGAAVQAAVLAVRLDVPLLVVDGELERRLRALRPTRILTLGSVELGAEALQLATVEPLEGPADVARVAGGAEYVALCNVADGTGSETAVLAAILAAARDGIVLPLELSTARHRISLERTDECPPGLEDVEGTGDYLAARVQTEAGEVLAGAAQTTVVRVATDDSPRYGRLRIDLDRDGSLEDDEEPRIGSSVDLGSRSYLLTYHYGHAFVGYLKAELILAETDPEDIRREIRALSDALGGVRHLALVGTPARIPFCYSEATGYFEAFDIKQELPSDAPYANLDDDSYLELAVGRLPVEDLTEGSAIIATTVAYPRLKGDWAERATVIQPGFHELEGALPWVLPNAEALVRGIEGDLAASGVRARGFYRTDVDMDALLDSMARSAWIAYFNHSGPGAWGIYPGASIVTGPAKKRADRSLPELEGAPIVFGGGCSSAALDVGRRLDRTFPGRLFQLGAVAYLGNTRVAYARSEHLVQLFFARLASGESTLGEAYRDGRNFLAHLLEGGHLVGSLELGIELGERDFLWAQYRIMNLFGDPALRPRLPGASDPSVEVELAASGRPGALLLRITNRGDDRRDPVQMMAASGQGAPREFFARSGPGMTSSHLPYHFVDRGLSPVRSAPEVQPGAWVDVELPDGAHAVSVTLASGPAWVERGFAVRPGPRGEPRLQMFVPLVRSTLERGDGDVVRLVEFLVTCETPGENGAAADERIQNAPSIHVEERWTPRLSGEPRIDAGARDLLERIRRRHARDGSPDGIAWTMPNPQPRFYGEAAHFAGSWDGEGRSSVEPRALPPHLEPRADELREAIRSVADLPYHAPLPPLAGMRVEATSANVLVLTPLGENEGHERTEVHVADDGTVERTLEHQFGLVEETRFEWRESERGLVLSRSASNDVIRPEEEIAYEVDYVAGDGFPLPARITLRMTGVLPRDVHFDFDYAGPTEASAPPK